MRIDAHQHFWQYNPGRHSWIGEDMKILRRDFMPGELLPFLLPSGIGGCVAVQADQSLSETEFLLQLAAENSFIRGVVGWVDLLSDDLEKTLASFQSAPKLKGFRHILQGEQDRSFMLQEQFIAGINLLQRYGYTYDILIYSDQLPFIPAFVKACPAQRFVIDHLAKPPVKNGSMQPWKTGIEAVAEFPNVHCKVSGMVTEADWEHWHVRDLHPYLDVVVDAFGTDRLLYGSDWPVCLVAADYATQYRIVKEYFQSFSASEQAAIFGGNATSFYQL